MCINATGAKRRQFTFFPVGLHFQYGNEPQGGASLSWILLVSLYSQHNLINFNQKSRVHLKTDEIFATACDYSNILYSDSGSGLESHIKMGHHKA